jgi:hypothetical protein
MAQPCAPKGDPLRKRNLKPEGDRRRHLRIQCSDEGRLVTPNGTRSLSQRKSRARSHEVAELAFNQKSEKNGVIFAEAVEIAPAITKG